MPQPAIKSLDPKILHEIHADLPHDYTGKPLVIGIDGNEANVEKRVGSNMVAYRLLLELARMEGDEGNGIEHEWIVYLKDKPRDDLPNETKRWKYRVIPMQRFWTILRLPWELFKQKEKLDVFFSPGHYAPYWCPAKLVTMVLDTAFFDFPEYFRKQDLAQLKSWTARSVKRADHVVAISQHTKNDILRYYGKFDNQVTVAYMGIDHQHFRFPQPDKEINRVKEKYKIQGDYILYVGTLQPRKNIAKLVEAFAKLKVKSQKLKVQSNVNGQMSNVSLVISGKKGWMYDEIFAKVKELGLEQLVIFTDFVPDEDLPGLMAGARCLALVALYEGFGIPVIEAQAVGTPGVVSNVSSLPEIVDHAGYLVDPNRVEDIAEKLGKMLDLSDEEYYKLTDKGIRHAALFTWEKTARRVLRVLEYVGGRPS
jgi:glycosyltransferase involved in cell wall biosynthesis